MRNIEKKISKLLTKEFEPFVFYLISQGISKLRIYRYLCCLKKIREYLNKPLSDATKEDIEKFLVRLELSNFSPYTKREYRQTIKKYYTFLGKSEIADFVKVGIKLSDRKLPMIIDESKVINMINSTNKLRDKCLLSLLYETGARIGEIMNLKKEDILFDDLGALVRLHGKTGERVIRCIFSAKYLREYVSQLNSNYLWIKSNGDPLTYDAIRKTIKRIAKRAGISERVFPYLFRHSRLTHLAKHLTESQLASFAGWIQGTKMAKVYVHLSSKDLDDTLKKLYVKCPNCGNLTPKYKKCMHCGADLKFI